LPTSIEKYLTLVQVNLYFSMPTGPSASVKVSNTKAHLHPLIKGKKYVISTTRDPEGRGQIAFLIFLFKGKKRQLYFKVDELVPGVEYSVAFTAKAEGESLQLTYWHRKGTKWIQLNSEKFEQGKP
jgi:hypothetical protein